MGVGQVQGNTAPPPGEPGVSSDAVNRRLSAGGPMGFVMSVHQTLEEFDRPYYYAGAVPEWISAKESDVQSPDEAFEEDYSKFEEGSMGAKRDINNTPHCIIHQYRKYPAKRRFSGTSDSPGGTRRQKTPDQTIYHDRPVPSNPDVPEDPDERSEKRRALNQHKKPPLWDSKEQIPDLIREYVDEDTTMYVTPWVYDVFVDFVLVADNQYLLQQMETDLMLVLRTFHDRSAVGASNLAGWFYQAVSGAPPEIGSDIPDHIPTRTLTWRLQQTEANAFPVAELNDIRVRLHGDQPLA